MATYAFTLLLNQNKLINRQLKKKKIYIYTSFKYIFLSQFNIA